MIDGREVLVLDRGDGSEVRYWERGLGGEFVPDVDIPEIDSNVDKIEDILDVMYRKDSVYSSYSLDRKHYIQKVDNP